MYEVEYAPGVERDIEDLPAPARRTCRAAIEMIRRDPWRGEPYSAHPREFRTWTFDHWGLIVYLIRERVVRVVLLQVTWAG